MPLALNDWIATFSLMVFAAILSLCSTSDAFIAATLISFPDVAKLAFLVFGPMFDLKLLFIYSAVFRKRFVAGLACRPFSLDRNDLRAIENPRTMTGSLQRYLSAGVLAIWGIMLGYFVISGRLASYLHPSFHIWTAVSGVVLVLLAAGLLFLPEHEDLECESCCDHLHDQRTPVRSGVTAAILVLPIVLAASSLSRSVRRGYGQ